MDEVELKMSEVDRTEPLNMTHDIRPGYLRQEIHET